MSDEAKLKTLKKTCLYIILICIVSYFIGVYLLNFFGITIPALRVAGGLVIFRSGWQLLNVKHKKEISGKIKEESDKKDDISFSPLAMPLLAGPGSMSFLITLYASRNDDWHLAIWQDVAAIIEAEKNKSAEPVKEEVKVVSENKSTAPVSTKTTVTVASQSANGERMKISPLAKKLAEDKGISVSALKGSGDNGRIIKRDIDNFKSNGAASTFVGVESFTEEPVSQMRKVIAKRLGESKFSAPHFYLTMEIDMDEAIKAREAINTVAGLKISFNDIVIKAVAASLRKHPKVNSSWLGDRIRYNNHIHIGVAIAVEEGLLVPVVRFADGKTLTQIGTEVRNYAVKAREKKLQPSDWEGNTFTISNLGMFGIEEFTAIINTPDSCILAVGGIKQIPVVKNGQIVAGHVMKVTLSCDHRTVDGAVGSAFLQTLKHNLENPVLMLGASSI